MEKLGSLVSRLCGACLLSVGSLVCVQAQAGPFKYAAGEKWEAEETMTVKMPGLSAEAGPGQVSRMIMKYSAIKLFPDGSALVKKECVKSFAGKTVADLKEVSAPEVPPVGYLLLTGNGGIYLVQARPVFSSPEEEEMAAGFDFPDELGELENAANTDDFLSGGREPMDQYKIAPAGTAIGAKASVGGFQVTRLKDENLGARSCEVYAAKRGVVVETVWFDRRNGKIAQRKIVQGDPASVEILQVRR